MKFANLLGFKHKKQSKKFLHIINQSTREKKSQTTSNYSKQFIISMDAENF